MHLDAGDEVCVRDEYLCVNGVRQFLHGRRVRDPGIPEVEACAFCGAPLDLNDFDHGRDPSESTLVEEMDDLECQACDAPVKGCTVVMWNRVQRVLKAGGIKVRRAS